MWCVFVWRGACELSMCGELRVRGVQRWIGGRLVINYARYNND